MRGDLLGAAFSAVLLDPHLGFGRCVELPAEDDEVTVCILGDGFDSASWVLSEAAARSVRGMVGDFISAEPKQRPGEGRVVEVNAIEDRQDRVRVVRFYSAGSVVATDPTTAGVGLRHDRVLTPRNLIASCLPRCDRFEFWGPTSGMADSFQARYGRRDRLPGLVRAAMTCGARGVVDLAWAVEDLVVALVSEQFGLLTAAGLPGPEALRSAVGTIWVNTRAWAQEAPGFDSVGDALGWWDVRRMHAAITADRDPRAVVPFADVYRDTGRTVPDLVNSCFRPVQFASFRWWGGR